jgi:hypothetical protein
MAPVSSRSETVQFRIYIASSATGEHSPWAFTLELPEKVEKELGEYYVAHEKKRAEDWLAAKKESARHKTQRKVLPLPD